MGLEPEHLADRAGERGEREGGKGHAERGGTEGRGGCTGGVWRGQYIEQVLAIDGHARRDAYVGRLMLPRTGGGAGRIKRTATA